MVETVIDAYIAECPVERQEILTQLKQVIKDVLPEAEEKIKYGIPTFYQNENIVHFSNAKNHIGFYPTPSAINHFETELIPYKTSKGAIQFSADQALPFELIREICLWRLEEMKRK
ncbi:iron chaperone [Vagococcus carniphilus]|uniref:iron chaperone n=1 Tax=Vagococcus carniphilus TaxID=218144 RepID=UPI003B5AC57B